MVDKPRISSSINSTSREEHLERQQHPQPLHPLLLPWRLPPQVPLQPFRRLRIRP
jgi:hypothetical protein